MLYFGGLLLTGGKKSFVRSVMCILFVFIFHLYCSFYYEFFMLIFLLKYTIIVVSCWISVAN